jgi:hypothetical protein
VRIRYAVDLDTGEVVSQRMDTLAFAWPILDFEGLIDEHGNATGPPRYTLEEISIRESRGCVAYSRLVFTRKIPVEVKNLHRKFWGMKELKQ